MSYKGLLNRVVTIQRSTEVISDSGEVSDGWSDLTTDVKCAITPRSANSRYEDYGVEVAFDHLAFFEGGTDLKPTLEDGPRDRIVDENDLTYEVVFVRDMSGRQRYLEALLRRIN